MLLELAQKYAALKKTKVIAHHVAGKEIVFVLESGPKLTMTESQLKLALSIAEKPQAGTAGGGEPTPAASHEVAPSATKKNKKEG